MKSGVGVEVGLGVPLLLELAGVLGSTCTAGAGFRFYSNGPVNEQRAVYPGPRGHNARAPLQELDARKENMLEIQLNYRSELS